MPHPRRAGADLPRRDTGEKRERERERESERERERARERERKEGRSEKERERSIWTFSMGGEQGEAKWTVGR